MTPLCGGHLSQATTPPVRFAVLINVLWVFASLLLLLSDLVHPTAVGTGFVVAHAAAVAAFAWLEVQGATLSGITSNGLTAADASPAKAVGVISDNCGGRQAPLRRQQRDTRYRSARPFLADASSDSSPTSLIRQWVRHRREFDTRRS
jgi:hypothetical protein